MRAVRYVDDGIAVVEVPSPSGEGVRVRVRSAGICGSDLHLLGTVEGLTLGHEIAGIAEDGTPVAVEPLSPCHQCDYCARGDVNLCVRGASMIHGIARDGGMADEILVPPSALVRLPTGIPVENACLVEPLAIAVHGFRRAGFRADQEVAVVGGGNIGLCAVAVARAAGARVALAARHEAQRAAGEALGAVPVEERGYDLVVEAAGSESALAQAAELARPGGRISGMGSYWTPVMLPGLALSLKEVDLVPASLYGRSGASRDTDAAAAILAERPEIADHLITHRFPLEGAPEAFATAARRSSGAIKVVLEP